jgi:hypothetical protein
MPGWLLSFSAETAGVPTGTPVEFGTDDYDADISATLQSGIAGGTYTFVVARLSDDHYAAIRALKIVKLYLYFRDNPSSPLGYLKNLVGVPGASNPSSSDLAQQLVADLRVLSIKRGIGERGYQTTIRARERIYDLLATTSLATSTAPPAALGDALDYIMANSQIPLQKGTHYRYYAPSPEPATGRIKAGASRSVLVSEIGDALERANRAYGRGMLLVRDGVLHVGKRDVPLAVSSDGRQTLNAASGQVESQPVDRQVEDPGPAGSADAARTRWQLTLSGRPDLKPGDFVTFPTPAGDEPAGGNGALGAIGAIIDLASSLVPGADNAAPIALYIDTVDHRLSRSNGFQTTVSGVEVASGAAADAWDARERTAAGTVGAGAAPQHPVAAGHAAAAVTSLVNRLIETREFPDVAEVRTFTPQDGDDANPAQTSRIWEGLANPPGADDAGPHQSRRLDPDRTQRNESVGVPYASPFAWGPCGLVLPRYPGTRVLVVHRDGDGSDPIDVGALWQDGDGPQNAQMGDYWLSLPAGTSPPAASLQDDEIPQSYGGNATNDLIDAQGNRAIEAGTFVMRVGAEMLAAAGKRPPVSSGDPVFSIEHTKNGKTARIAINADASITIHSDAGLSFETSGDIKLTAANVKVGVSGTMDVSPQ